MYTCALLLLWPLLIYTIHILTDYDTATVLLFLAVFELLGFACLLSLLAFCAPYPSLKHPYTSVAYLHAPVCPHMPPLCIRMATSTHICFQTGIATP